MKFSKHIKEAVAALAVLLVGIGCNEWTEVENNRILNDDLVNSDRPESYYEDLRQWKASEHSISFGWFSGWADPSLTMDHMLQQLPDSMDMVSLWGNSTNLSPEKIADLRETQRKGTKVLMCTFLNYVGQNFTPPEHNTDEETRNKFWGWEFGNNEGNLKALEKYADAICDTINKYGYDGLDIDFEPKVDGVSGPLDENDYYVGYMFDLLKDRLGPKSGSGKILAIDGELWEINAQQATYFDYFIAQAYSVSGGVPPANAGVSDTNMESRLSRIVNLFNSQLAEEGITNKFVVTENMESALDALKGGFYWTANNSEYLHGRQSKDTCPSLVGMATWQPQNGFRKGGFGGYRFDAEAANSPVYKWMRRAIQAQIDPSIITNKNN